MGTSQRFEAHRSQFFADFDDFGSTYNPLRCLGNFVPTTTTTTTTTTDIQTDCFTPCACTRDNNVECDSCIYHHNAYIHDCVHHCTVYVGHAQAGLNYGCRSTICCCYSYWHSPQALQLLDASAVPRICALVWRMSTFDLSLSHTHLEHVPCAPHLHQSESKATAQQKT